MCQASLLGVEISLPSVPSSFARLRPHFPVTRTPVVLDEDPPELPRFHSIPSARLHVRSHSAGPSVRTSVYEFEGNTIQSRTCVSQDVTPHGGTRVLPGRETHLRVPRQTGDGHSACRCRCPLFLGSMVHPHALVPLFLHPAAHAIPVARVPTCVPTHVHSPQGRACVHSLLLIPVKHLAHGISTLNVPFAC